MLESHVLVRCPWFESHDVPDQRHPHLGLRPDVEESQADTQLRIKSKLLSCYASERP